MKTVTLLMATASSLLVVGAAVANAQSSLSDGSRGESGARAQDALSIANNDSVLIDASTFKVSAGKAKGDVSAGIRMPGVHELGPGAIVFRSGGKLYIMEPNVGPQGVLVAAYDAGNPRRFALDGGFNRGLGDGSATTGSTSGEPRRYAYDTSGRFVPDAAHPQAYDAGDPRRYAYDTSGRFVPDAAHPQAYDAGDPRRYAYDTSGRFIGDSARPNAYDASDPRRFALDNGFNRGAAATSGAGPSESGNPRRYAYDPNEPHDPSTYNPAGERHTVYINDPMYAQYRLKKIFEENWTPAK